MCDHGVRMCLNIIGKGHQENCVFCGKELGPPPPYISRFNVKIIHEETPLSDIDKRINKFYLKHEHKLSLVEKHLLQKVYGKPLFKITNKQVKLLQKIFEKYGV